MDEKTARKLTKAQYHLANLSDTAVVDDLRDFVIDTDPADWDADVIRAHAKALEATGCHLRRLLADLESQGVVTA